MDNCMEIRFASLPQNEAFARAAVSAFLVQTNPTLNTLSEIRTAISEAVTNAVVHGYAQKEGLIILRALLKEDNLEIEVEDFGRGIADIQEAMEPFFTSEPEQERTGIGFSLMQAFMDTVFVDSQLEKGTLVKMKKRLSGQSI